MFPSRQVALELFGFSIHWYGLLYLLGFLIAAWLLPRLQKCRDLQWSRDQWLNMLSWSVLGVIAGGRLGYVLLYEPSYFAQHPLEVFSVWNGGMSFHGGLIGVGITLFLFCHKHRVSILRIADIVVVPVAIGLALGRLGNFINLELYGTVTSLPWGISIPEVEELRHPTQFYAMGKDLFIAGVCYWILSARLRRADGQMARWSDGHVTALFLILYGVGRFIVEFFREQQYPLVDLLGISLTRGQLLTLPVGLFGIGLIRYIWKKRPDRRAKN